MTGKGTCRERVPKAQCLFSQEILRRDRAFQRAMAMLFYSKKRNSNSHGWRVKRSGVIIAVGQCQLRTFYAELASVGGALRGLTPANNRCGPTPSVLCSMEPHLQTPRGEGHRLPNSLCPRLLIPNDRFFFCCNLENYTSPRLPV